jgi:hypothetical protein
MCHPKSLRNKNENEKQKKQMQHRSVLLTLCHAPLVKDLAVFNNYILYTLLIVAGKRKSSVGSIFVVF